MDENLTAEWFEEIIKKSSWLNEDSDPVEKVVDLLVEDAIPVGFNYSGRLLRLKATVKYRSRTNQLSVILKCTPLNQDQCNFISEHRLFLAETMTYDNVLSKMETLMQNCGVISELDWPKHFTVSKENSLLLQDLKELGYSTVKQRELNYEEGKLVVQALGRYHAMSLLLIHKQAFHTDQYKVNHMAENNTIIQFVYISSLKAIIDAIRSTNHKQWFTYVDTVESNLNKVEPALKKIVKSSFGSYNVLNHGDCWLNNLMFQYSAQSNQPLSIKLIDFQLGYYNSLAWDLVHFIYCSFLPATRKQIIDKLILQYRSSLIQTLQQLKSEHLVNDLPTEEEILQMMDKLRLFGCLVSLATIPRLVPSITCSLDLDITLPDHAHKAKTAVFSLPQVLEHVEEDLTSVSNILLHF